MELMEEIRIEGTFFPADGDDHEVVIGFEFFDEIAEEAEVLIAFGEELFEVEGEFQLKSVVGGCEAEDAEDGDYRPASDGGK